MEPVLLPEHELTIREVQPADESAVLEVLTASADYFTAATGLPAAPGDLQSLYYALPDGAEWDDKLILIAVSGTGVVGVIDAVLRYPGPADCSVGLFLIHPGARRSGLGAAACAVLLARAGREGIERVTATTPAGWAPGTAFLRSQGFALEEAGPARETIANRSAGPYEQPVTRAVLTISQA
jgi:GNAT superfamily N-acetyltransferase